jgi:hypothetical protein
MVTIKVKDANIGKHFAMWGTYGKGGWEHCKGTCPEHQYREVRLMDCSTEHLQTLWTNDWLTGDYESVVEAILDDRGEPYELPESEPVYKYVVQFRRVPRLVNRAFRGLRIEYDTQYRIVKRRIS